MQVLRRFFGSREPEPVGEEGPLFAEVKSAMADVQAYARSHGGSIQLVGVNDEGTVQIKFEGACSGCPMSALTLRHGIEERLKLLVPSVKKVIDITR